MTSSVPLICPMLRSDISHQPKDRALPCSCLTIRPLTSRATTLISACASPTLNTRIQSNAPEYNSGKKSRVATEYLCAEMTMSFSYDGLVATYF